MSRKWPMSNHGRCREMETRYVPANEHTKTRTVARTVRCMEPLGHDPASTPHRWRGIPFGVALKGIR